MPIVLKPGEVNIKDPTNMYYMGTNVIAERTTDQMLAELQERGEGIVEDASDAMDAAEARAADFLEDLEDDLDAAETRKTTIAGQMSTATSQMQSAADGIEAQKNTMIASIASVAGQGTDTTMTQSGVAADAAAVGDLKSALNSFATSEYEFTGWEFRSGDIINTGAYNSSDNTRISVKPASMKAIEKGDFIYCDAQYTVRTFIYKAYGLSASTYYARLNDVSGGIVYLGDYDGYMAAVTISKVGYESSDISSDVATIGNHVKYFQIKTEDVLNGISMSKQNVTGASDVTQKTVITPVYHYGDVLTANSDSSGTIDLAEVKKLYSDEIYLGNAGTVKIETVTGYTYRVAAYNENHAYVRQKSVRSETSEPTEMLIFDRPNIYNIKYLRIVFKRTDSAKMSETDFAALKNAKITITTNNCYFFNARKLNNPLINGMSHQGFDPTSNVHGSPNRMTSFWGAYERGFDTILCNVRFTSDGEMILNHDPTITIGGITYTISDTTYSTLASAFTAENSYLPTFDDICWFCKLTGMEIFSANSYTGSQLDSMWSVIKKYQLQKHMMWIADDYTFAEILEKDNKSRLFFYYTPEGSTAVEIAASISEQVATMNTRALAYPDAEFTLWLLPVEVNSDYQIFADALVIINGELTANNAFTGVCLVNNRDMYVKLAPYMTAFHSDYVTSGNAIEEVQIAILNRFPIIGDNIRLI